MSDEINLVPGSEGGVSSPVGETPNASDSGVSKVETPAPSSNPVDVDALKAKYEKDLNAMKSTLQRQTAQVEKEWQSRYGELQREMHSIRMQGMTEEERARYERQLESEEFQSLQSRLAELENEKASQAATVNAFGFFINQGVPAEKLNLAEGYDAVVQSGWQYLTEELARLRTAAANPQPVKPIEPAPLKPAPSVITDKGIPASGTTWAALRAQYGSDEAVYRAVEEGRLPASVIPTN
jgi:uncharacterized coiled-coil protein SlyX